MYYIDYNSIAGGDINGRFLRFTLVKVIKCKLDGKGFLFSESVDILQIMCQITTPEVFHIKSSGAVIWHIFRRMEPK